MIITICNGYVQTNTPLAGDAVRRLQLKLAHLLIYLTHMCTHLPLPQPLLQLRMHLPRPQPQLSLMLLVPGPLAQTQLYQ